MCGVLLSLNCMLWGGKGDASSALEWTYLNEKIQKNLIKVSLMRQPIFSALWCINHTFLFYDQIFFFKLSLNTCFYLNCMRNSILYSRKSLQLNVCGEKKSILHAYIFFMLYRQIFLCIRFQNSLVS